MQDVLTDIAATLARRFRQTARRQMGSALLVGVALLFAGVAIVAGIVAIGVVLAARWGVLAACLIIAAAALVLALVLMTIVAQQTKAARRRQRAEREQWHQAVLAAKAIAPDLTAGKALLIAVSLGLLVGLTSGTNDQKGKS